MGRQAGTLSSDRILDDLHRQRLSLSHCSSDFRQLTAGIRFQRGDIRGVDKSRFFQTDIDESGLHAGQYPHDLSLVDIADNTAAAAALYMHFLQATVLDHRYPDFLGRHIDQQLFTHCIFPFCRQRGQIPTAANRPAVSQSGKPITAE